MAATPAPRLKAYSTRLPLINFTIGYTTDAAAATATVVMKVNAGKSVHLASASTCLMMVPSGRDDGPVFAKTETVLSVIIYSHEVLGFEALGSTAISEWLVKFLCRFFRN